jgi:hypothetical protein
MLHYCGYDIVKRPPPTGSQWECCYVVMWGGVVVCTEPTLEFAKNWVDQIQARFEAAQANRSQT